MTETELLKLYPNASKAFIHANSQTKGTHPKGTPPWPDTPPSPPATFTHFDGLTIKPTTDVQKLNKTETAFLDHLKAGKHLFVLTQAITLKLGDDCRYTPDFVTIDPTVITAWEVKGFWRDDARVKIKCAARNFPWIRFVAVQRSKANWTFEAINP